MMDEEDGVMPEDWEEWLSGFGEYEAKCMILRVGLLYFAEKRLGKADKNIFAALADINDMERLVRMNMRMVEKVSSWQELLQTP